MCLSPNLIIFFFCLNFKFSSQFLKIQQVYVAFWYHSVSWCNTLIPSRPSRSKEFTELFVIAEKITANFAENQLQKKAIAVKIGSVLGNSGKLMEKSIYIYRVLSVYLSKWDKINQKVSKLLFFKLLHMFIVH